MKKLSCFVVLTVIFAVIAAGCGGGGNEITPPPNTEITVNAPATAGGVGRDQVVRYSFLLKESKKYKLIIICQTGAIGRYISRTSPFVSEMNYDFTYRGAGDEFTIYSVENSRWYVGIKDNGNANGSTFTIQVVSF